MKQRIMNRYTTACLWESDHDTLKESLEAAVKSDANLADANLAGAYLAGANLAGANLVNANLADANLVGANLADANLVGANLVNANLADANLAGTNLVNANLADANLAGTNLLGAWSSHDLLAEILRRAAGADIEKRKIAGLVLISRDWCWPRFLGLEEPLRDWALDALAEYVKDGDGAPDELKRRKAAKAGQSVSEVIR